MSKNFTLATVLFGFLLVAPIQLSAQETTTPPAAPTTPPAAPAAAAASPFRGMVRPEADPRLQAGMREELTMNLREISRLIGQVDPRDTQFLETLRKEQASLVEQLKGFESPAAAPPTAAGLDAAAPTLPPVQQNVDRRAPALESFPGDPLPSNWQQMSPDELAKIFAEQRRTQPAAMPDRLPPAVPPRGFQPPAPFGAGGAPAFGAPASQPLEGFSVPPADAIPNRLPWSAQQQPSQEITELKETITALQKQIEQMRAEVKALDTQMQLLNQNILLKMSNQPAK